MHYEIKGDNLPVVICRLENGESMISEAGAMSWMSPNMYMDTTGGGAGKMVGRMFAGERLFQNVYTSQGNGIIAFASKFPGSIRAFQISPENDMVFQKRSFLASESGVELSVFFNKKIGSGFFGGEGFIMQRTSGNGIVFAEFDGSVIEYELKPGQQIVISTGNLAAMTASCSIDIRTVPGLKNKFLGGEGFFNTVVMGPGKVWLQTMPMYSVAAALRPFMGSNN